MATSFHYLEITDGDLSAVFMAADGSPTPYTLVWDTWAPAIAVPNPSELGLPYTSVTEEWRLNIIAATPALCLTYLQTLNKLFDRAWRWWNKRHRINGSDVPVLIKYQLAGSTQTVPMQDVVIITEDRVPVLLPTNFTQVGNFYRIEGIKARFTRKNGLWLGATDTANVAATAAPGPIKVSYLETAAIVDPVAATLTASASGGVKTTSASGVIICANRNNDYDIIEGAASGSGASKVFSGTTGTADSTNLATNGYVGRITATTSNSSYTSSAFTGNNGAEYMAVYAVMKNGSTTVDVIVYVEAITTGGRTIAMPEVTLFAVNPSVPQVLFCGMLRSDLNGEFITQMRLNVRSVSGSITVDIDYAVAVWCERTTSFLTLNSIDPSLGIVVDHAMLTQAQALVQRSSTVRNLDYAGNPYMLYGGTAQDFSMLVMLVQSNFWNVANVAGTSAAQWALSATRTKGFLTPE